MLLGTIFGKITTTHFSFKVNGDPKKFEYCQVYHNQYGFVLCQIVELTRRDDSVTATCIVLGYKDDDGTIKSMREPFQAGAEVLRAQDGFITDVVKLDTSSNGALIGNLEGRDINIYLDLQTLLTKHLAVLAKSGAGKSYCVGVLIEEILSKNVPLLVIDPHGEYDTLTEKSENERDAVRLSKYGLKPKGFGRKVQVYGDEQSLEDIPHIKPLKISDSLTSEELLNMLPSKLSASQEGLLYSAMKQSTDFDELLMYLEVEESPSKWHVMKMIEHLKQTNIFAKHSVSYAELLKSGFASVLNLKGIPPSVQEILVYKVLKDLFELRKLNKVPPFFCVIEEAHNFCPERGFGQAASSPILRTIASEGRKFGMGLAIISQRPARVDKSVLSQVSTQIILKVTNPNDLKAIGNSVEGITKESENEIQNLSIGHALVTGVVDVPLFVQIRPRMTKHGGESVNMLENAQNDELFFDKLEEFEDQELLPVLEPNVSKRDMALMADVDSKVKTALIPCVIYLCESKGDQFPILIDRLNGAVITDIVSAKYSKLPDLEKMTQKELDVLQKAFEIKKFTLQKFIQLYGYGLDVKELLTRLVSKKYLDYDETTGGKYAVNDHYILSNLKHYAVYDKIQFKKIAYDKKLEPRISLEELQTKLNKFVDVKDSRDCFLVKYEAV